jgi:hypothetical protein
MDLDSWMLGYRRAWESNEPEEIGALFSEDAEYYTAPSQEPWRGRAAIVEGWIAVADGPGDTTFEWEPIVEAAGLAVIQGRTVYRDGDDYDNLWVIRFDSDGSCREFTEWWMKR